MNSYRFSRAALLRDVGADHRDVPFLEEGNQRRPVPVGHESREAGTLTLRPQQQHVARRDRETGLRFPRRHDLRGDARLRQVEQQAAGDDAALGRQDGGSRASLVGDDLVEVVPVVDLAFVLDVAKRVEVRDRPPVALDFLALEEGPTLFAKHVRQRAAGVDRPGAGHRLRRPPTELL